MGSQGEEMALSLSPAEAKVLVLLRPYSPGKPARDEDLLRGSGLSIETVRGSLERLRAKRLAQSEERPTETLRLTARGEEALNKGLPERRLFSELSRGPISQEEALARGGLDKGEFAVAIGRLKHLGLLKSVGKSLEMIEPVPGDPFPEEAALGKVAKGEYTRAKEGVEPLLRRGLVALERRTTRLWSLSEEGRRLPVVTEGTLAVGALTSAHLRGGSWASAQLRPYDVHAAVPYLSGARTHRYLSWLREFEEILLGLGFEEWGGPIAETEFYNADALFVPQNHPARTMQEVFSLSEGASGSMLKGRLPPEELLERVAAIHEGRPLAIGKESLSIGWGTPYEREIARRVVLRSHTTTISVRYLLSGPVPPFRMYAIGPVFRRDAIDATHHIQFDQCEGVFGGREVSLRHLLGLFTQLAHAMGIGEVRFKPTYFPFTEPSVEGYVKHPALGWIEVLPGGLFRPEVLRPLGIDVPVAAWGIGICRLAMISLGLTDIRELFSDNVEELADSRI